MLIMPLIIIRHHSSYFLLQIILITSNLPFWHLAGYVIDLGYKYRQLLILMRNRTREFHVGRI